MSGWGVSWVGGWGVSWVSGWGVSWVGGGMCGCIDEKSCEIKKGGGWEGGLKYHKLWNTT